MTSNDKQAIKGHILIVDDDPIVSGMLAASLGKHGYAVTCADCGESCLQQISSSASLPDVVIMDIEMPGINGYETCRILTSQPETQELPVIFLSSLESLEDRLTAYDSGAFDFIGKPFNPEVMRRKIDIAMRVKANRERQVGEKKTADNTAMTAIFSLGELGIALKFTRDSLRCRSLKSLATLAINALKTNDLEVHVQIRTEHHGTLTMTAMGPANPLEVSVIEMSSRQGRIFQFSKRLIVNYDSVSILILNLPTDDAELTGRIRDYVAIICETCEAAVENILLRLDAKARAEELRHLVEITQTAVSNLQARYLMQQSDARFELDQMISSMEDMYVSLGLLESQEATVSHLIHSAKHKIMERLEHGMVGEAEFAEILSKLTQAADYSVALDDEFEAVDTDAEDDIELW